MSKLQSAEEIRADIMQAGRWRKNIFWGMLCFAICHFIIGFWAVLVLAVIASFLLWCAQQALRENLRKAMWHTAPGMQHSRDEPIDITALVRRVD